MQHGSQQKLKKENNCGQGWRDVKGLVVYSLSADLPICWQTVSVISPDCVWDEKSPFYTFLIFSHPTQSTRPIWRYRTKFDRSRVRVSQGHDNLENMLSVFHIFAPSQWRFRFLNPKYHCFSSNSISQNFLNTALVLVLFFIYVFLFLCLYSSCHFMSWVLWKRYPSESVPSPRPGSPDHGPRRRIEAMTKQRSNDCDEAIVCSKIFMEINRNQWRLFFLRLIIRLFWHQSAGLVDDESFLVPFPEGPGIIPASSTTQVTK